MLNYKTAVKYVPPDPAQRQPAEIADEIVLLLDQREQIERGLRDREPYFLGRIDEIAEIDKELLRKRHSLLALAPWYAKIRRGKGVPAFHWWWYLDKLPTRQCPECQAEMEIEMVSLTMRYNGAQETAPGFLVYVCPQCGARDIPSLSFGGFQELLGSVLDYSRARARKPQHRHKVPSMAFSD